MPPPISLSLAVVATDALTEASRCCQRRRRRRENISRKKGGKNKIPIVFELPFQAPGCRTGRCSEPPGKTVKAGVKFVVAKYPVHFRRYEIQLVHRPPGGEEEMRKGESKVKHLWSVQLQSMARFSRRFSAFYLRPLAG